MSTIIFEQVPCKKSPAKPNKVLYTFLRTYHFFLIFLEHYGKSGKNIQRKNLPKKEVKSLGTLVINPWSLNLILLLSCDSPTNSDNLNVRAGIMLISWWQGCFFFFFCTTTKCRSLSRLPLSPGWADNIRLPFFPMSLACSQWRRIPNHTWPYCKCSHRAVVALRPGGNRSLNKPSPPLRSKLSSPFFFPGNPLELCNSLPH